MTKTKSPCPEQRGNPTKVTGLFLKCTHDEERSKTRGNRKQQEAIGSDDDNNSNNSSSSNAGDDDDDDNDDDDDERRGNKTKKQEATETAKMAPLPTTKTTTMLSRVAFFSFYNYSTIVPMNKKMVDTCEKMLGLRERCGRVSFSIYSILLSVMERLDTTRNTTRVAAFGSNEVLIPRCKY